MCVFPLSEGERVTAETVVDGGSEKAPEVTTVNTVPATEEEVTLSSVATAAAGEMRIMLQIDVEQADHLKAK